MSIKIVQTGQGKSASLPCIASTSSLNNPNEVYVFEWTKNGQTIYSGSNDGEDEGYPAHKYKGRLKHTVQGALNFKSVVPDDQGHYLCTVKYMNKPAQIPDSSVVQLVVNRGPKVTMRPPDGSTVFRKQMQQAKFECVTSDDNPKIEWLRNKQPLHKSDRLHFHDKNRMLILKELQQSDSGEYGCLATNIFGETYQRITLVLPVNVHFAEQLKNQTAQIGRPFIWHCRAFGHPENITYEWLFNDQKLPFANGLALRSTQLNGTLSIKPVTKEDNGKFTCRASNGYGNAAASSAFLDVQYHPLVIIQSTSSVQYLGENLTAARINCYFDANPPLFNVRWSKGGRTLSATKHRFMHFSSISTENGRLFHAWFEFRQVHPKDAGQYSCQAYNSAGASDIFEIYAVIAKPPRFTRIPPRNVVKRQGDALEVTCDGDSPEQKNTNAAHKVKIYWKKKSTVIDGSTDIVFHDKSLKIRSISYKDHGCYDCLVENEVASLTSEMCLIVNDTPPQPPVNATVQSSCCDSTVSWNPGHNGGYRQWFILKYREKSSSSTLWHVANMTANSSSTRFTATNLIPGTTYEYVIQPYNAMGQGYVVHLISKTKNVPQDTEEQSSREIYFGKPQNLTVLFFDDRLRFSWSEGQLSDTLVGRSYILEYRRSNVHSERNKKAVEKQPSSSHKFEPLMNDIPQNNIDIHPEQPPALMAGSTYDFRVRSKIPSTGWLSEPSDIVKYHLPDFSDQESTVLAAVGGSSVVFIISLLVIAILFAATRHKKVKRDERTPSFRRSTNGTANRSNHASREPHDEQLKSCSNNSNGYLLHHNKISDAPSKPDYEHSPSNSFLLIGQAPNGFMNDNRSEFDADQEKERNSFFPEFENTNLAMFPYSRESRV